MAILGETSSQKATDLPKQLTANLDRTDFFHILDKRSFLETTLGAGLDGKSEPDYEAWKKIGTDFLIKGSIRESESALTLELRLFDVGLGRQMLGKSYKGKPEDARKMINQFSNAVLEATTGEPGVFGSQIIFVSGEKSKNL